MEFDTKDQVLFSFENMKNKNSLKCVLLLCKHPHTTANLTWHKLSLVRQEMSKHTHTHTQRHTNVWSPLSKHFIKCDDTYKCKECRIGISNVLVIYEIWRTGNIDSLELNNMITFIAFHCNDLRVAPSNVWFWKRNHK